MKEHAEALPTANSTFSRGPCSPLKTSPQSNSDGLFAAPIGSTIFSGFIYARIQPSSLEASFATSLVARSNIFARDSDTPAWVFMQGPQASILLGEKQGYRIGLGGRLETDHHSIYLASPDFGRSAESELTKSYVATMLSTGGQGWYGREFKTAPILTEADKIREEFLDTVNAMKDGSHRDLRVLDRLTALYRDSIEEDEVIRSGSLSQLRAFFLENPTLAVPKITLTPSGTLRIRWIPDQEQFTAIEFTGKALCRLVTRIRRGSHLATSFISEPLSNLMTIASAIGAAF